ncbi:MAG: TIGR02270 family protein [Candidatus Thiodiazotropha sp.]
MIQEILIQHAEEAAFLWLLRNDAITAPHYTLQDLYDLEERIEAHLDGLRIAGERGWAVCQEQLEIAEVGELFVAGYMALDSSREAGLEAVFQTLDAAPESISGFISALGWVKREKLQGRVVNWLNSEIALLRRLGLSACSVQRVDCGTYLAPALDDPDPSVRARALRCIGEVRRHDLKDPLLDHLQDDDEACRFWSAWAATHLGEELGVVSLRGIAERAAAFSEPAFELALRASDKATAVNWLRELSTKPEMARMVVQGSGYFGDPASIPWLIEKMKTPELARVAGEAFSLITGLDLAYHDLQGEEPEAFQAGPTEDPDDEDVSMDIDEDLPWPEYPLIADWWVKNQQQFPSGQRLLTGSEITQENCFEVLSTGYQRQRCAAAIELAVIDADHPLLNTSATAREQMRAQDLFRAS